MRSRGGLQWPRVKRSSPGTHINPDMAAVYPVRMRSNCSFAEAALLEIFIYEAMQLRTSIYVV